MTIDTPPEQLRSWALEMPSGMKLLNANDRSHWGKQLPYKKALRDTAYYLAKQAKIPQLQRAKMIGVYEPPDRRQRDPANWHPSWKAVVDGVVRAGVLPDDNSTYLDGPYAELGDLHPKGRVILHIIELPPAE